jgi:hypothetical protein
VKLTQNVGTIDRIARLALAVVLGAAFLTGAVAAPLGYVAAVLAVTMLATALSGFCPIYSLLRIRTCPIQRT